MSELLTDDKVSQYVSGGGVKCPYCDSTDIDGGERDYGSGDLYQEVSCRSCR